MEGTPPFLGNNKSHKNEMDKLQYGNIKERLNLHVKRRLNVQPQIPKGASVGPIEVTSDPGTSGDVLEANTSSISQKIHEIPKVTRRPYTRRKDKTRSPIGSNNAKTVANVANGEISGPMKCALNRNIHDQANSGPVVAVRKYNKRRNLNNAENNLVLTNDGASGGGGGGGGDEDSQDVEVRGRLNERDKNLDILSVVLNLKKRSLMQCPEIQDVIKSIANAYKNQN